MKTWEGRCKSQVRFFNKGTPFVENVDSVAAWDGVPAFVNPQVEVRPREVAEKCTFCVHRIDKGIKVSACVEACPAQCMVFGDLDDPQSEISKQITRKGTFQLKPDKKLNPNSITAPTPTDREEGIAGQPFGLPR